MKIHSKLNLKSTVRNKRQNLKQILMRSNNSQIKKDMLKPIPILNTMKTS